MLEKNESKIIIAGIVFILLYTCLLWILLRPSSINTTVGKINKMRDKYTKTLKEKYIRRQEKYYVDLSNKIKQKLIPILENNVSSNGEGFLVNPDTELSPALERLKNAQIGLTNSQDGTHTLDKFQINLCDAAHTDRAILNMDMLVGANIIIKECTCPSETPCFDETAEQDNKCNAREKNITMNDLKENLKYKSYSEHVATSMIGSQYNKPDDVPINQVYKKIVDEGICNHKHEDCQKRVAIIQMSDYEVKVPLINYTNDKALQSKIDNNHVVDTSNFEFNKIIKLKFDESNEINFINMDLNNSNNTLLHVMIHEYAHVINDTIGHDIKWQTLFDHLLVIAASQGWYEIRKDPDLKTYCDAKYDE